MDDRVPCSHFRCTGTRAPRGFADLPYPSSSDDGESTIPLTQDFTRC
jgi:hypothetical protein